MATAVPLVCSTAPAPSGEKTRLTLDAIWNALDSGRTCRLVRNVLWSAEILGDLNPYKVGMKGSTGADKLTVCPEGAEPRAYADFATSRNAREAVCEALVFVADILEYETIDLRQAHPHPRKTIALKLARLDADCARLKSIRRRLECELWP